VLRRSARRFTLKGEAGLGCEGLSGSRNEKGRVAVEGGCGMNLRGDRVKGKRPTNGCHI